MWPVSSGETLLKLEKLEKRIADFTLTADFTVAPGERAALIGRSGSGKTTLLRMIAGLDSADSGQILLEDRDVTKVPARERGIGVVFQEPLLFPSLSVVENAVFGLKTRGTPRERILEQGLQWLDRVGLKALAHAPVQRLSGGEAQRVAFVRALIWKPRAVLLDEPFSALDPALRKVLRSELLELHRLSPVPLLLVSHDEEDLEKLATVKLTLSEAPGSSRRSVGRS